MASGVRVMRAPQGVGVPLASVELLTSAVSEIEDAVASPRAADRYIKGHRVARRAAAAVLAARAHPDQSRAPRNVWELLPGVAPELREWAEFFSAGTGRRIAAEAGLDVVNAREADDLVRDAHNFLDIVVALLVRGSDRRAQ